MREIWSRFCLNRIPQKLVDGPAPGRLQPAEQFPIETTREKAVSFSFPVLGLLQG
jgi:hypothetical protein